MQDQDFVMRRASVSAWGVASRGVDRTGCDYDDYRMMFAASAWGSQQNPRCPAGTDDRRAWMTAAINHTATNAVRKRGRAMPRVYGTGDTWACPRMNAEDYTAAQEVLERLRALFPPRDWEALVAFAETSHPTETWRFLGCPGTFSAFYCRLQRIRGRARRILKQMEVKHG